MKKKEMKTKVMAVAMSATMAASICPAVPAMAVTKDQVAKDGTYTKTAHVTDSEEEGWNEYNIDLSLSIANGKIAGITVNPDDSYDSESDSYFSWAKEGRTRKGKYYPGYESLIGKDATEDTINSWDAVSSATCTSKAVKEAALAAIQSAPEASTAATVDTAALEASITKAKALKESDYTAETWNTLKTALASAETALAEKKSQDTVDAAKKNLDSAIDNLKAAVKEEYKYVYAGLSWAEYWAAEGVQAAGDSSSSSELDTKGESDKGAFDVVTRATVNHGLHRGSYQCAATIEAENGKSYEVSYWTDSKTAVLTDGKTITFDRGAITEEDGTTTKMKKYDVTGLKYVPVKVATEDYEAFCKAYKVVENGGELAGGFAENKLQSYKGLKAKVTADTNGLKTATKNADGTFSFSAKETGTESGIEGQELKTAPTAEEAGLTVKEAKGSYGEFLRVDLTGNYGDLGANMQSVKWTYYGDDSTYTNAKAAYGTKFAADNWMHKSMGIQLGLTKSLRCTLPEGTDGTGYWTITISALGYKDVTYNFQAKDENIVKDAKEEISTTNLEAAVVLQDKSIKAVLVTENHDDEKFFNRAMDVVKNIMKKQSTDVDVVSGATYSSNGLINAVKNALKEAEKVTNGQTTEPDKEEADTSELEKAMKEAEELKQEDYTEATYAVLKTRMEDAQKLLDADKTEISQEDVDQALENLNQALALLEKKDDGKDDTTVYKNGIYEGRALCRPDEDEDFTAYNLTLQVTVRDDKIVAVTDVKGDGDSSNDRYILRAENGTSNKKGVTSQLIEKGNTEGIDVVSGATCTSKAILDACENALLSAKRQ